jgi:hypothetical protein
MNTSTIFILIIVIAIGETLGIIIAQALIIAIMYAFRKPIARMYMRSFFDFVNDKELQAEFEKEGTAFAESIVNNDFADYANFNKKQQEPNIDDEPLVI